MGQVTSPRRCVAAAVLTGSLLLGGCQGEAEPEAADSTPTSDPGRPTEDASTGGAVAPATGPRVSTRNVTVRLPPGWVVDYQGAERSSALDRRAMSGGFFLSQSRHVGSADLDRQAASTKRSMSYSPPLPERREDLSVDGVRGFVFAGRVGDGSYAYEFGAVNDGVSVSMTFFFDVPEERALETIASIMASWQWT